MHSLVSIVKQNVICVKARISKEKLVAKIGLPGARYVKEVVQLASQRFKKWRFVAGQNKLYERLVASPIDTVITDCLRDLDLCQAHMVQTRSGKSSLDLFLQTFIDGWKDSLHMRARLRGPSSCFMYSGEYHRVSPVMFWKDIARAGEQNLKKYSKYFDELESVLGKVIVIHTDRGPLLVTIQPDSWVNDNKSIWHCNSTFVGSMGDIFRPFSRPWMWSRRFFIGGSIFKMEEHIHQYEMFQARVQAHMIAELKSKGEEASLEAVSAAFSGAASARALDYAVTLVGQKYRSRPLLANTTSPSSPLLQMRQVVPVLHAILHQVEVTASLAHQFYTETKKTPRTLVANNEALGRELRKDNKPRATYVARKLANWMGTDLADSLYKLQASDPRRAYHAAYRLHALFIRRVYDGQNYSPRSNFTTLAYSLFTLSLFNDLCQRSQKKNPMETVHWAHMYSISEMEYRFKLVLVDHLEERFEASFVPGGVVRQAARGASVNERERLRAGMERLENGKAPAKRKKGSGWQAGVKNLTPMHTRDVVVAMHCSNQRLTPRHPIFRKKKHSFALELGKTHGEYIKVPVHPCDCWVCEENPRSPDAKSEDSEEDEHERLPEQPRAQPPKGPGKRYIKCCNFHKLAKKKRKKKKGPACLSLRNFRADIWDGCKIAVERGQGQFISLQPPASCFLLAQDFKADGKSGGLLLNVLARCRRSDLR